MRGAPSRVLWAYRSLCAAAAAPRAVPAPAAGGRAVPGRAAAPHLRRGHHVRGARGGPRGRRVPRRVHARHAAAHRQRAQPGVLRRRRRLLHQVREQDHAAARAALLRGHVHVQGVTGGALWPDRAHASDAG